MGGHTSKRPAKKKAGKLGKLRAGRVRASEGINFRYPDTLSTFTANFHISSAAACLALAGATARGTR